MTTLEKAYLNPQIYDNKIYLPSLVFNKFHIMFAAQKNNKAPEVGPMDRRAMSSLRCLEGSKRGQVVEKQSLSLLLFLC